jgi:Domain of unknown function (DUF4832)/Beta-galactosidase
MKQLSYSAPIRVLAIACIVCLGAIGLHSYIAPSYAQSATITWNPVPINYNEPEIVNPLRGYYQWYRENAVPQPEPAQDRYARFMWRDLEPQEGKYDFQKIETALQQAQQAGAKFAFRIMAVSSNDNPVGIPEHVKQASIGQFCRYLDAGSNESQHVWVPDWSDLRFLARANALMMALGERFNGDRRLAYYDMGLYGHWGEWHLYNLCTPEASDQTKRALIDMQIKAFSKTRIVMNSGADNRDSFTYALSQSPRVGIRVDSLGMPWFDQQFKNSDKLPLVQERWKTAPIVVEFTGPGMDYELSARQVKTWHVAAVGNGNGVDWNKHSTQQRDHLIQVGKNAGYRFVVNQFAYPSTIQSGQPLTIQSQWSNLGVTPLYEPFKITYELRAQGKPPIVWASTSGFDLEKFLPTAQPFQNTDTFQMPKLAPGNYELSMAVLDTSGYRPPLKLAIQGINSFGRYQLGMITIR